MFLVDAIVDTNLDEIDPVTTLDSASSIGERRKSVQFLMTAHCKMNIFHPLAAMSPQGPHGRAIRNEVLADS